MNLVDIFRLNNTLKIAFLGLLSITITSVFGEIPFVHSVISDNNGHVCQYSVIFQEIDLKTNPNVTYAWHRNGQLRSTRGDFSGNILHGSFQEFDKSGRMLEKGTYFLGTKDGKWKSWNRNGEITKIENWKRGFLKRRINYELSQCIIENFKKNQLSKRRTIFNNNDKTKVEHYRKGALIAKNKKSHKNIFRSKMKKEASNEVNDK